MQAQPYIVKQPIHDRDSNLVAYEIMYIEGDDDQTQSEIRDSEAAGAVETLLTQFRDEGFLEGRTALVALTPQLLIKNVPQIFDAHKFIIQIDEQVLLNPNAMKLVSKYRKLRYKIALKGFEFNSRYLAALDHVDIVKVNFSERSEDPEAIIRTVKGLGKQVMAYYVDSERSYERAMTAGADFMEGSYIGSVLPERIRNLHHLEGNFFQLMSAVTKDDAEFDEIEMLIERDVTLTYRLMKLVNSAYFALRNKAQSVHQALVILGLGQLRQWIYLLSFRQDTEVPTEFIKTSFTRAVFCQELLPLAAGVPLSRGEAYLMGMFSTLGALLDMPLEDALSSLDLSDDLRNALLTREGPAGKLYDLVLQYEQGDWIAMSNDAEDLSIPISLISQKYYETMQSVDETWNALMGSAS